MRSGPDEYALGLNTIAKATSMHEKDVQDLLIAEHALFTTDSLDEPYGEEDFTLGESDQSPSVPDISLELENEERRKALNAAFESLEPRQKMILELHLGLTGKRLPFTAIARRMKLTSQRIGAIYGVAEFNLVSEFSKNCDDESILQDFIRRKQENKRKNNRNRSA